MMQVSGDPDARLDYSDMCAATQDEVGQPMIAQAEIDLRLQLIMNLEKQKIQLDKLILTERIALESLVKGGSHGNSTP